MVCRNHFKSKYTRFLIKYHLIIFLSIFIMTNGAIGLVIYKYDQIHFRDLLKGFVVHGTKTSDEYRKLIALIRETQTTHLFPHSHTSKTYQQIPYASFHPNINPLRKRFYLPTCPILPYTELTFSLKENLTSLFDDIDAFQASCKLEVNFKLKFTNCSSGYCCNYIGLVDLLFDGQLISSNQCDLITLNQLEMFRTQWFSCNTSLCDKTYLYTYVSYFKSSPLIWKIYINLENTSNQTENLFYLYDNHHNYQYKNQFSLINIQLNSYDEEILFVHLLNKNRWIIILTLSFYVLCLLLFVKNLFFILIILQQTFLTLFSTFVLYIYFFQFPLAILNYTGVSLYLFILLIDSFLWYTCWFINNHRRDDCTINRIIENLLTQTFYYILPKNLTAILILVITYTNQIIALQCFTVFTFLLIVISFLISFILYPVCFVFLLRYKSSIPTIEHFLHRFLSSRLRSSIIDRAIAYLIVRLKAFWLVLLSIIACCSFLIIFQWPKLQFNVSQLTFDLFKQENFNQIKSLDFDITYYIGSKWEVPNEGMIPIRDIPLLDYNAENKMTSTPGGKYTFEYALEKNLSQLIQFCTQLKLALNQNENYRKKKTNYKHYYRHINSHNQSFNESLHRNQYLIVKNLHCFGDLSPSESLNTFSNTQFFPIITNHFNQSHDCKHICYSNQASNTYQCIICLNSLYYNMNKDNDLVLIKNGLRFLNDAQYPRYLFQTINYQWKILTNINNYFEWKLLIEYLKKNIFVEFYSQTFTHMSFWYSSEIFSTFTLLEQLEQEKYLLTGIKFVFILIFLALFTGVLGIFVTLTTLCNFLTCIALLTLINYKLTVENLSFFTIVLIICSQYSVLYSISYKLAPTFFFQRENRTLYSLKQLCITLLHLTLSILFISIPCFCSSLSYLFKISVIYSLTSIISLFYSTFFLQSLLCYIGPADQTCLFIPIRLKCKRQLHSNNHDQSLRKSSTISRRHQRMSTSSYFQSSYVSQIFTGSTYFESEYGGINEALFNSSRRRESSRSYQISHIFKRNSLLTGELIELYTPRASLAPYGHHFHHPRYSRQLSVSRGIPMTAPTRPLYVSPSMSPFSQISIHSQGGVHQRSLSPQISRPSRSPSPRSYARLSSTGSLRPCYSAPRLHASMQRSQMSNQTRKKSVLIIQRQDAISSLDDHEQLTAETKRKILKSTAAEASGAVWMKRSNSS